MYFDLEDLRPDTPRVPSVISRREGILLSIIAHLLVVLAYVLMPASWFEHEVTPVQPVVQRPDESVRYVDIRPAVDRVAPPRPNVDQSDIDRRSATRDRAVVPETPTPFSRGNTPEKVQGAPEERAAGAVTPQPPAPDPAKPASDVAAKVLPETPAAPPRAAAGNLGDALRSIKRFLQEQNFENPKGGQTDQDPDIQFDSKGVEFGPWLRRFVTQVKHNWFVPDTAMFRSGRVVIQFNVHKDGTITDLKVVGPSSIESFNLSALNSLRLSNPTLPLPAEYPSDKAFFTVTFHYNEGFTG